MKRGPRSILLALLAVLFVTWLVFAPRGRPKTDSAPATSTVATAPPATFVTGPAPRVRVSEPAPAEPEPAPSTVAPLKPALTSANYTDEQKGVSVHAEAIKEIERVQGMLRDYRTAFGENPVGTNAEIVVALNGGNPKQARLGPPDGYGLNEKGELVDRWGTPYFFHQIGSQSMEIHSAGPDKILGTPDDLVMR